MPERRLLVLGLIGGWPGAILAQRLLRHKTIKPAFRRAFVASVMVHLAASAAIIAASDGAAAHDVFNLQTMSREFAVAVAAGAEGVEGREA